MGYSSWGPKSWTWHKSLEVTKAQRQDLPHIPRRRISRGTLLCTLLLQLPFPCGAGSKVTVRPVGWKGWGSYCEVPGSDWIFLIFPQSLIMHLFFTGVRVEGRRGKFLDLLSEPLQCTCSNVESIGKCGVWFSLLTLQMYLWKERVKVFVTQSVWLFCDPMHCSPPGSSVHGILQARMLEWVTIPFSRRSYWPRDQIWVSCIAGRFFAI